MKLSILIPGLADRIIPFSAELLQHLSKQMQPEVEILFHCDNGEATTGAKRNYLKAAATGDYFIYIDDDDWVPDDYVACLVNTIDANPGVDVISFEVIQFWDGEQRAHIPFSMHGDEHYRPSHVTGAWRRELLKDTWFVDQFRAEDSLFANDALPLVKTDVFIPKVLYHYRVRTNNQTCIDNQRKRFNNNAPALDHIRYPVVLDPGTRATLIKERERRDRREGRQWNRK